MKHGDPLEPAKQKDIQADFKELNKLLNDNADDLSPAQYIEAKRYLNQLSGAIQALSDKSSVQSVNGAEVARGKKSAQRVSHRHAPVQGPHCRVALHRGESRHPQVTPHQVIAAFAHHVAARSTRLPVAFDAAAHLDRQHAKIGDQFARRFEAVDVEDEGRQHGGADRPDAGNGVEVVGRGQTAVGADEQAFQAFDPGDGVAQLPHLVAHQLCRGWARQRGDRTACLFEQPGDVRLGQVGDAGQIVSSGGSQQFGGGVSVDQLEDPAYREILDEHRQFGKDQGYQVV